MILYINTLLYINKQILIAFVHLVIPLADIFVFFFLLLFFSYAFSIVLSCVCHSFSLLYKSVCLCVCDRDILEMWSTLVNVTAESDGWSQSYNLSLQHYHDCLHSENNTKIEYENLCISILSIISPLVIARELKLSGIKNLD